MLRNQRDGHHRQAIHRGRVAYEPNSLAGGSPAQAGYRRGFTTFPEHIVEDKVRGKAELFAEVGVTVPDALKARGAELQSHGKTVIFVGDTTQVLGLIAVADVLHKAVDTAIQLCGARGYSKDTLLEWIYRYARQARLVDGASEVHKMVLARFFLDGGPDFWRWGTPESGRGKK